MKRFLKINHLKQIDVANYLGISESFMSQIVNGTRQLPPDKRELLLKNKDWDSTPLLYQELTDYMEEQRAKIIGKLTTKNKIPLYDDAPTIGGTNDQVANVDDSARPTEWIDAGDWFPTATSAIHHYGDSMTEYPSGCILALKRVNDSRFLLNGENYVIETDEFRITKRILDDGDDIIAYSTNQETYPDGRLVHAPIRIPKDAIRHLDLVLGCVIRKFSTPVRIR